MEDPTIESDMSSTPTNSASSVQQRGGRRALMRQPRADSLSSSSSSLSLPTPLPPSSYSSKPIISPALTDTSDMSMHSAEEGDVGVRDEACFIRSGKRIDPLSVLPMELASAIVGHLEDPRDVLRAASASQRWRQLALQRPIWHRLFLTREAQGWQVMDGMELLWSRLAMIEPAATPLGGIEGTDLDTTNSIDRYGRGLPTYLHHRALSHAAPDWYSIYKARHYLDQRWEQSETAPALVPRFSPRIHRIGGHEESVYCIRLDSRPYTLTSDVLASLDEAHRNGPLYDPSTSLGIGSRGRIFTGSRDNTIKIWDGDSLFCLHTLRQHTGSILCLDFDEHILVSGSSDRTAIVWDLTPLAQGQAPVVLQQLQGHTAGVLDVALSERFILTCGKDATVGVYDRLDGYRRIHVYRQHAGPVNAGCLSTFNGHLHAVTASGEGSIQLWQVETGQLVRSLTGHAKGLACVKFVNNTIISGSNDQTIRIWDATTGQCLFVCRDHRDLVRAVAFDHRRRIIVSGGYDGRVKLFDLSHHLDPDVVRLASEVDIAATADLAPFPQGHQRIFDVQMDSTRILSCGDTPFICIRDFAERTPIMRLFA